MRCLFRHWLCAFHLFLANMHSVEFNGGINFPLHLAQLGT